MSCTYVILSALVAGFAATIGLYLLMSKVKMSGNTESTVGNTGSPVTSSNALPILFVSHGGGPCWFIDSTKQDTMMREMDVRSRSADFMRNLRSIAGIPRKPRAILVISAHWEEATHTVTTAAHPNLFFDYYGFPDHTYKLQWPVPGEPTVAQDVKELLNSHGIECREDGKRGLDHGVFIPLMLAYPEADIPVLQVSLRKSLSIVEHLQLGEALQSLRTQGVVIIGSGQTTHNFGEMGVSKTPEWCHRFGRWFHDVLTNVSYSAEQRKQMLVDSRKEPSFASAHPRIEHYMPAVVTCAAAGYQPGTVLYEEIVLGSMLMSTVKFE